MIKTRLEVIRQDVQRYSPHPEKVRIVAVSKKQSIEKMLAAEEAGITDIGENRIQDALNKFSIEPFNGIKRHFIGYLQTNKANKCLQNFDWLHSLQTEKLAKLIANSEHRIKCLIEVNISGEENKSGIMPDELSSFVKKVREFKGLEVHGLMGMAAFTDDEKTIRSSFSLLKQLANDNKALETDHLKMNELSMGMTHDYRIALEEGSTFLRIGTGIFGPRSMN
ncbi:MAG: YggS family pyridoxal phosphate-dependent enzyme [Candidatus Marinimicrobia bacterium]|nr:YggS family pyridoxal phosphate-dependent enzyme [Candidatus Neomarinimicrobiota bacterium]